MDGIVCTALGSGGDRFKYTGREYESVTGLSYHRARYDDAAISRWYDEDPIGFAAGPWSVPESRPHRPSLQDRTHFG
jgi:RHS repeat-associated protein